MIIDFSKLSYQLSIDGSEFALLRMAIEMTFGAPPQVICSIVPMDFIESKVVDIQKSDSLFWKYVADSGSLLGKPVASLSISSAGADGDINFNAKNWVLSDITMSAAATASNPASLDIVIQHPIVQLSKYPASAGPVKSPPPIDDIKGSSYLEIVKSALEVYSKFVSDSAKQQPSWSLFEEGISKVDEYLKCEYCDVSSLTNLFPWVGDSNRLIAGFKHYILSCIESGSSSSNLLSFVTGPLLSELSLGLYYDTEDISASKMIIRPKTPFSPSDCVDINCSMVTSMRHTPGNWLDPSGVYASSSKLKLPSFNAPERNGQSMQEPLFVSVAVKDGGTQVVPIAIPGWINSMLGYAYSRSYYNAPDKISGDPQSLDFSSSEHVKSLQKILTQYFLDMYLQSKNIVISRQFSFYDDGAGRFLVPGRPCKLSGLSQDDGLLFMTMFVEHTIDFLGNHAATAISGNYVRGTGFSANVLGADPEQLISDGFSGFENYIWG